MIEIECHKEASGIRLALAGNPNCGKTTIFNALTGARQHVGNYPGITVERRAGFFKLGENDAEVVDLPGTYSLTSYSPEEKVTQEELLSGTHDVVVVVADSTCLKRNLVLLAQVMQLGANPVLCLNMADEAHSAGQKLDIEQMAKLLGFPVVETVGHKRQGIEKLKQAIMDAAAHPVTKHRLVLGEQLDRAIAAIRRTMSPPLAESRAADWLATQLLLADIGKQVEHQLADELNAFREAKRQQTHLVRETGLDVSLLVTERMFGFVDGLLREVMIQELRADARAVSDRIDKVLAHPWLGLPVFAAVLYGLFALTFTLGEIPMGWLEAGFASIGDAVSSWWPVGSDSKLRSLLVDGIIAGVGGVVVFLPNIMLLFLGLALLEDTGYLSRAAFLTDRFMHRAGLHGKSFVPLLTGLGCSVPGIMATRTLENKRDRLATMLVLPLIPCGARLPIWLLLVPAFFTPSQSATVFFLIYAIGIGMALLLAKLLRKTVLAGEEAPFVMELPPYRMPTLQGALHKMMERSLAYLRKAGTLILGLSIVLWVLMSYPKSHSYEVDSLLDSGALVELTEGVDAEALGERAITREKIERRRTSEDLNASIMGRLGHALEPLFKPLGFDWKIVTATLGALAGKEMFVAQMSILYSMDEKVEDKAALRTALARDYSSLVGFALILFLLISSPCVATFAVTRRESGKLSLACLQFFGLTAFAYVTAFLVYQMGRLMI